MNDYIKWCQEHISNLGTDELFHYADLYNECQSPGDEVTRVKAMIEAEVERRIAQWESA